MPLQVPKLKIEDWQYLPFEEYGDGPGQIAIEYITDWWDGPLSGVCFRRHGKRYFFSILEYETDDRPKRRYAMFALTEKQIKDQDYWHQLFLDKIKNRPNDTLEQHKKNFYTPYNEYNFEPVQKDQLVGTFTY